MKSSKSSNALLVMYPTPFLLFDKLKTFLFEIGQAYFLWSVLLITYKQCILLLCLLYSIATCRKWHLLDIHDRAPLLDFAPPLDFFLLWMSRRQWRSNSFSQHYCIHTRNWGFVAFFASQHFTPFPTMHAVVICPALS